MLRCNATKLTFRNLRLHDTDVFKVAAHNFGLAVASRPETGLLLFGSIQ